MKYIRSSAFNMRAMQKRYAFLTLILHWNDQYRISLRAAINTSSLFFEWNLDPLEQSMPEATTSFLPRALSSVSIADDTRLGANRFSRQSDESSFSESTKSSSRKKTLSNFLPNIKAKTRKSFKSRASDQSGVSMPGHFTPGAPASISSGASSVSTITEQGSRESMMDFASSPHGSAVSLLDNHTPSFHPAEHGESADVSENENAGHAPPPHRRVSSASTPVAEAASPMAPPISPLDDSVTSSVQKKSLSDASSSIYSDVTSNANRSLSTPNSSLLIDQTMNGAKNPVPRAAYYELRNLLQSFQNDTPYYDKSESEVLKQFDQAISGIEPFFRDSEQLHTTGRLLAQLLQKLPLHAFPDPHTSKAKIVDDSVRVRLENLLRLADIAQQYQKPQYDIQPAPSHENGLTGKAVAVAGAVSGLTGLKNLGQMINVGTAANTVRSFTGSLTGARPAALNGTAHFLDGLVYYAKKLPPGVKILENIEQFAERAGCPNIERIKPVDRLFGAVSFQSGAGLRSAAFNQHHGAAIDATSEIGTNETARISSETLALSHEMLLFDCDNPQAVETPNPATAKKPPQDTNVQEPQSWSSWVKGIVGYANVFEVVDAKVKHDTEKSLSKLFGSEVRIGNLERLQQGFTKYRANNVTIANPAYASWPILAKVREVEANINPFKVVIGRHSVEKISFYDADINAEVVNGSLNIMSVMRNLALNDQNLQGDGQLSAMDIEARNVNLNFRANNHVGVVASIPKAEGNIKEIKGQQSKDVQMNVEGSWTKGETDNIKGKFELAVGPLKASSPPPFNVNFSVADDSDSITLGKADIDEVAIELSRSGKSAGKLITKLNGKDASGMPWQNSVKSSNTVREILDSGQMRYEGSVSIKSLLEIAGYSG